MTSSGFRTKKIGLQKELAERRGGGGRKAAQAAVEAETLAAFVMLEAYGQAFHVGFGRAFGAEGAGRASCNAQSLGEYAFKFVQGHGSSVRDQSSLPSSAAGGRGISTASLLVMMPKPLLRLYWTMPRPGDQLREMSCGATLRMLSLADW